MYQGLIDLAYRHNKMRAIHSSVVREGDTFEFGKGTEQYIRHTPAAQKRGKLTHAYAVVELTTGGRYIEVMNAMEVNNVKNASPSVRRRKSTPWTGDFEEEMWRKTVTRRALKYAPRTSEMREALALDTAAEMHEPQNLDVDAMIIGDAGELREDRADVDRTAYELEERLAIQEEGNGNT
jgi:phage RecT family recombinase